MKKQIKNIIYISIIFSFLIVSPTTSVFAAAPLTTYQKNVSNNAAAKAALSWGIQGAKAVSKCAIGFAGKAAINGLTNLVISLLKLNVAEVSVKDQTAQNAEALSNCVASVAIGLAKDQIVKITKSTFNWINTGLGGDPLYVSNMSNLLNQVENTVISSELSVFRDSQYAEMYPYGRDFASAQIQTQRSMSDHLYGLQSSLFDALTIDDQALNAADKLASYSHNFAQGGWNGWLSLTQNPQNNPLGFNMLATDQLAYQKEVAVVNKTEEINRGGGIQDKKECVQYGITTKAAAATTAANKTWGSYDANDAAIEDLGIATHNLNIVKDKLTSDQKSHDDALAAIRVANGVWGPEVIKTWADLISADKTSIKTAQAAYDTASSNLNKADAAYKYTHNSAGETCKEYATVTPGSVIKDQLSKVITSPVVQLEMVRTLDDALGSVLDTLMGKLQDSGIKGIDELFNTEKSTVPGMALNSSGELIMGQETGSSRTTGAFDLKDLGNTYIEVDANKGDYMLNTDGSFTYKGDNNGNYIIDKKGVIQIQNDYITAAKQNITLFNNIMPALGELDYCIPGPNPNWEQNSQNIFMDLQSRSQQAKNSSKLLDCVGCYNVFTGYKNAAAKTQAQNFANDNIRINTERATTPYILSLYDTYKNSINSTYGPTSPMLDQNSIPTATCINNATNPPVCTTGATIPADPNLTSTPTYGDSCSSGVLLYGGGCNDPSETPEQVITGYTYSCKADSGTELNTDNDPPTCQKINKSCTNGATNFPTCTKTSTECKNTADNFPTCTTTTTVTTSQYLPMASAGQNITAGMVQTYTNVTDAKTKYLTNISDTEEALKELQKIADEYNAIIKDAEDRRAKSTSTGGLQTSIGPQCTFNELIN